MSGAIGTFAIGQTPIGGFYYQTYTARVMIEDALNGAGLLGTGQNALTTEYASTLRMLNNMIGQWNRRRWLIWHLLDISLPMTGAERYSIGIGGDYDRPRPDRLEAAYFRQFTNAPNHIDYPLGILESMEDYSRIALKTLNSFANVIFYDAAFPIGYVYPYPIALDNATYELHLIVKDTLNQIPSVDSTITLPAEYYEAIWSNLALRLAAFFPGANVNEFTVGLAKASLATIRSANAQIPRLRMPARLGRGALYNIFSGQVYAACKD